VLAALFAFTGTLRPVVRSLTSSGHRHFEAISGMADLGIIDGYTSGYFGPDDAVTRQQFAKMIVNALDLPVSESELCRFPTWPNS